MNKSKIVILSDYNISDINHYLVQHKYVVDRVDKNGDNLFFLLKKVVNRCQKVYIISRSDTFFMLDKLNKLLDDDYYVVDVYKHSRRMVYLIEKQTLQEKRNEKLKKINN